MDQTYLTRQRHILLDMHVPDWDPRFLAAFDPARVVELYASSGADAAMIYCNSHVGLCYWPTKSGRVHRAAIGKDFVRTQVDLLHDRGLAVCAYYSGPVYNGWAYTEHPDWRIVASSPGGIAGPGSRYGVVCPTNAENVAFNEAQVDELVTSYPFDAFFFDMVFWPSVCVCSSCRDRYRREEGREIPEVLDWASAEWCRFQAARERWLADAFARLRAVVKRSRDIPVFMNAFPIRDGWVRGCSEELLALNDMASGDFVVNSMFSTLSRWTPTVLQYMAPTSGYGAPSSHLMPLDELMAHAQSATAFGGQFMIIDAVGVDGTLNPAVYERLRTVSGAMQPYEGFLGGKPLADVAVYWSMEAAVDFVDDGLRLDELQGAISRNSLPHPLAAEGAIEALRREHLPYTVVTRADLDRLDEFAVVILPNVLRMRPEEVEAIRGYVERGGRVYASGHTSITSTDGTQHADFMLADMFGCRLVREETVPLSYLKPATDDIAAWIAPLRYVVHGEHAVPSPRFGAPRAAVQIEALPGAQVLATTTYPYGDGRGTRDDEGWASIHASPPWEDTPNPAIVRNAFGDGEVVYASVDLERVAGSADAARALFIGIIKGLIGHPPQFDADAHPNVWMTVFDDPGDYRLRICLLNRPTQHDQQLGSFNVPAWLPTLPIPELTIRVAAPAGRSFTGLVRIPGGEALPFVTDERGALVARIRDLATFEMLAASYG